ncbi:hypothetical protein F4802DRAFT_422229 [Xylaria palmicola]|nr:hypothetical protein F4802DRAFT_422229 [Xylaria palmicola]
MAAQFAPKQLVPIDSAALKEFLGTATEDIAYAALRPLVPLADGSHVHDNGCGAGAVSSALFALHASSSSPTASASASSSSPSSPPSTSTPRFRVSATDKDPAPLSALAARARREGWGAHVEGRQADSAGLGLFADDAFSLSVTNFVLLQAWPHDGACATEIYRTLRPGGLAVVTAWEDLPTMAVFCQAHRRLRPQPGDDGGRAEERGRGEGEGEDGDLPPMLRMHWYGGQYVRKALLDAGFDEGRIRVESYGTRVRIHDARRWCEIGWTLCGAGSAGWTVDDEVRWDERIDTALEILVAGPWYERDQASQNSGWLTFTASATLATK